MNTDRWPLFCSVLCHLFYKSQTIPIDVWASKTQHNKTSIAHENCASLWLRTSEKYAELAVSYFINARDFC